MPKICTIEDCNNPVFTHGYCVNHKDHYYYKNSGNMNKPRKTISPISKKQENALAEYRILRDEYMSQHPYCECGCGRKSIDLHHKYGRGKNLCNVETFMAVCRPHHRWIHDNPKTAREKGWLI